MNSTELIQLINDAYNSSDQATIASIILEVRPTDPTVITELIKKFNVGQENVNKHLEAAEFLSSKSSVLSDFNTITRSALLSNAIKVAKEKPADDENENPVSFGKI